MKKKLYSLLVIISLLFSNIGFVYATEESIEETIVETTEQIPQENTPDETVESPTSTSDAIPENLPTRTAKLRIETSEGVLFEDSVTFSACKPYETSEEYTLNAKCLIEQTDGLDVVWAPGDDAWLDRINQYGTNFSTGLYWTYFVNLEYGSVALNRLPVHEGDEVLLAYGINPLKIEMDTLSPTLYTTTTVRVYEFGFDEFWAPVWLPSNSSTLLLDGDSVAVSQNGEVALAFDALDIQTLRAVKAGFAQSNTIDVHSVLPTTRAELYAVAHGQTLFHDTVEVSACRPDEAQIERYTLNAKCLIDQSLLAVSWNYYGGPGAFLDSINDYTTDWNNNYWWVYMINLQPEETLALNQYQLREGDEILIYYNALPLDIAFSTTTPVVGTTSSISVLEFSYPQWISTTNTILTINGEIHELGESSQYELNITTTTPYLIRAEKEGYITIEKTLVATTTQSTGESTGNNEGTGNSGGSSGESTTNPVQRMIQFLDSTQNADGSFGSTPFLSDWAALAYGSWTGSSQGLSLLKNYLATDPNPLDGPNTTANYARRAMALMAVGVNPYSGTATNYIEKIIAEFDGKQFGDTGLINDDIFALVPLLKAGYQHDALVASTTTFIVEHQEANGSFGSVDLTAAAIQALSPLSSITGVSDALVRAKAYLKSAERTDGGFGDVYATGWALQAISALGDTSAEWLLNGNSPVSYITQKQAADGGLLVEDSTTNRIWSTSYAIPGLLGKSWNTILASFEKPGTTHGTGESSTTTTPEIVTSTPVLGDTASSTPTSTIDVIIEETDASSTVISSRPLASVSERTIALTPTIVRGERITENEEITTESEDTITPTSSAEIVLGETTATPDSPPSLAKYIFWGSSAALLLVLGYTWSTRPTSKK